MQIGQLPSLNGHFPPHNERSLLSAKSKDLPNRIIRKLHVYQTASCTRVAGPNNLNTIIKTNTTVDKPNVFLLRITFSPGRPFIARLIGILTVARSPRRPIRELASADSVRYRRYPDKHLSPTASKNNNQRSLRQQK